MSDAISLAYQKSDDEFINILKESKSYADIIKKLGYKCTSSSVAKLIKQRINELNFNFKTSFEKDEISVSNKTKKEIFEERKNWQSARSAIRKVANKVFKESKIPKKCIICGYDKHIEIAHIKAVSEFSDDTLISEINDINNLVPLCPNHHWEFDNGILSKDEIINALMTFK